MLIHTGISAISILRNGRYDEAFAELRRASEADPELLPQLFNLVWEIYSNDPKALKNVGWTKRRCAGANFALYLLGQKRFEEGLRLWNDLSSEDKKANKDTARSDRRTLIRELRFHDALKVWNDIAD